MAAFSTEKPPVVLHGVHQTGPHSLVLVFDGNPQAREAYARWLESGRAWEDFGTWADSQLTPEMQALADTVHDLMCGSAAQAGGCARYRPGSAHHDFFQARAGQITESLEPLVGSANIAAVVKAVVGEVI
jgi:hypothetical protein